MDLDIDGAPLGSMPIIFVFGLNCLKTFIAPEINPPPPIGINR